MEQRFRERQRETEKGSACTIETGKVKMKEEGMEAQREKERDIERKYV